MADVCGGNTNKNTSDADGMLLMQVVKFVWLPRQCRTNECLTKVRSTYGVFTASRRAKSPSSPALTQPLSAPTSPAVEKWRFFAKLS